MKKLSTSERMLRHANAVPVGGGDYIIEGGDYDPSYEDKYEFTDRYVRLQKAVGKEVILHEIRAVKAFETPDRCRVERGDLGGFIEHDANVFQQGPKDQNPWVHQGCAIAGKARMIESSLIGGSLSGTKNDFLVEKGTVSVDDFDAFVDGDVQLEGRANLYGGQVRTNEIDLD